MNNLIHNYPTRRFDHSMSLCKNSIFVDIALQVQISSQLIILKLLKKKTINIFSYFDNIDVCMEVQVQFTKILYMYLLLFFVLLYFILSIFIISSCNCDRRNCDRIITSFSEQNIQCTLLHHIINILFSNNSFKLW